MVWPWAATLTRKRAGQTNPWFPSEDKPRHSALPSVPSTLVSIDMDMDIEEAPAG